MKINIILFFFTWFIFACSSTENELKTEDNNHKQNQKIDTLPEAEDKPVAQPRPIHFQLDTNGNLTTSNYIDSLLKKHNPRFKKLPLPSFASECTYPDNYSCNAHQAPYAVIGKINNDTIADLILLGENELIGILSEGEKYKIISILKESYSYKGNATSTLFFSPKNTYESPFEEKPLHLKTDGFLLYFCGKAGAIYYYNEGEFHNYYIYD